MFFNYLLLALRNLKKQRGYATINILGLAIGLASAIFIFLYVKDELTFDSQHPYASQTYRLGYRIEYPNGDHQAYPAAPAGWDNYIKDNYPGIEKITSFTNTGMPTSIAYEEKDRIVLTEEIIWAESNYGETLFLPLQQGDAATALNDINSMVISESAARELFGNEDPLNRLVTVSHQWMTQGKKIQMMITGVYRDFPANTHMRPEYICNILSLKETMPFLETALNTSMGDGDNGFWTQSFFVCADEGKIPAIQEDLQKRANAIIEKYKLDFTFRPLVRKITDVHFDQEIDWSISHKSADKKYTYVFITIALLIVLVACINYINLATAKSAGRAKEIGLRKTFGGIRTQLVVQFLSESFLLVMLATLVALLLVILFMPAFNDITGKTFSPGYLFDPIMLLIVLGVIVFVTLLAGSYPALFVAGFEPATVLKGKFSFRKGSHVFRQFLTTVQFVVAVTLLTGAVIVVRQMNLMRHSKLNEAGNQIVSIRYGGFIGAATDQKYLAYKDRLIQNPVIEAVTLANHLPRLDYFGPIGMHMQFPEVNEEKYEWYQLNGDYDFPKTFGMTLLAGRYFDAANLRDSSAVLLNEAAVKALKLSPNEVIGKAIVRPDYVMGYSMPDSTKAPVTGLVIGVVEDFPYRSMYHKIEPLAISPKPHTDDRIIHVRVAAGQLGEAIPLMEQQWKSVFPDFGFDHWFVDDEFGRMYENEAQVAELTEKFSALAILITCVGLYGLAAFLSEQRTKEIGIRKSLGASHGQVLWLLLKTFGVLLLIGCAVGIPVAYWAASQWLKTFVYQTPINALLFAGVTGAIALITFVSVGYESLKASLSNPVKALKHE
ncbi:MAG: ABC transporter permease [Cyclobacteriaceae bacterium]|jgi:putative ABC transport system permease protein|nr:ABC transporter permease [Cyclobacteriaceae bacterium]